MREFFYLEATLCFSGYDMVSGRGVAGLSLRSRSAVLALINSNGGVGFATSTTGSEDFVFKTHLKKIAPKEVGGSFCLSLCVLAMCH